MEPEVWGILKDNFPFKGPSAGFPFTWWEGTHIHICICKYSGYLALTASALGFSAGSPSHLPSPLPWRHSAVQSAGRSEPSRAAAHGVRQLVPHVFLDARVHWEYCAL